MAYPTGYSVAQMTKYFYENLVDPVTNTLKTSANITITNNNMEIVDSAGNALIGQKAMVASLPVVIASNQSIVPVSNPVLTDIADGTAHAAKVREVDAAGAGMIGQKAMAASKPVVIASDQSAVPVTETYTGISNGKYAIAVTNAVESIVAVSTPCKKVILRAASTNLNNIFYGGASVALDGTNSDFLEPGSWVEIPISDLNLIRVRGTITEVVAFTFVN